MNTEGAIHRDPQKGWMDTMTGTLPKAKPPLDREKLKCAFKSVRAANAEMRKPKPCHQIVLSHLNDAQIDMALAGVETPLIGGTQSLVEGGT